MAKKHANGRKPSGVSAIAVIDDEDEIVDTIEETTDEADEEPAPAPKREKKPKAARPQAAKVQPTADHATNGHANSSHATNGNVSVADIRKAASFVGAVGGLEKALSLLQILKVAKESL